MKYCWDKNGNSGTVYCVGAFAGVGAGGIGGVEFTYDDSPTLCDFLGVDFGTTVGLGKGLGGSVTTRPTGFDVILGIGGGGYAAGGIGGRCSFTDPERNKKCANCGE